MDSHIKTMKIKTLEIDESLGPSSIIMWLSVNGFPSRGSWRGRSRRADPCAAGPGRNPGPGSNQYNYGPPAEDVRNLVSKPKQWLKDFYNQVAYSSYCV